MAIRETVDRELIRALVARQITCPRTGALLDVRDCVVLRDSDGDPAYVMSQAGWADVVEGGGGALLEASHGLKADPATVRT